MKHQGLINEPQMTSAPPPRHRKTTPIIANLRRDVTIFGGQQYDTAFIGRRENRLSYKIAARASLPRTKYKAL